MGIWDIFICAKIRNRQHSDRSLKKYQKSFKFSAMAWSFLLLIDRCMHNGFLLLRRDVDFETLEKCNKSGQFY